MGVQSTTGPLRALRVRGWGSAWTSRPIDVDRPTNDRMALNDVISDLDLADIATGQFVHVVLAEFGTTTGRSALPSERRLAVAATRERFRSVVWPLTAELYSIAPDRIATVVVADETTADELVTSIAAHLDHVGTEGLRIRAGRATVRDADDCEAGLLLDAAAIDLAA